MLNILSFLFKAFQYTALIFISKKLLKKELSIEQKKGMNYYQCETSLCLRGLDQFHTITYSLKWVKASWTYSIDSKSYVCYEPFCSSALHVCLCLTVCPRSLDQFYIHLVYSKLLYESLVKTSWTMDYYY